MPRWCGTTRDSGVLPGERARLKESLKIIPSTPTELFHIPPLVAVRLVGAYKQPMGRPACLDGHALVPVTGQFSPLYQSKLPLFATPPELLPPRRIRWLRGSLHGIFKLPRTDDGIICY